MLIKDARVTQIIFLGLFLLLGVSTRDWTIQPDLILVVITSCLVTQWLLSALVEYSKRSSEYTLSSIVSELNILISPKVLTSLRSALITSLGLCLLLRSNSPQTMILAGFLAIASKFLFRHHQKHFFNPANFGIIAAITLTNDAWVSPGQWGYRLVVFTAVSGLRGCGIKTSWALGYLHRFSPLLRHPRSYP